MASMFYVNKQGGACSSFLCQEALQPWDFCMKHDIVLEAAHLLGSGTCWWITSEVPFLLATRGFFIMRSPGSLSRGGELPKWSGSHQQIEQEMPLVLFNAHQVSKGSLSDAFFLSWADNVLYAFPPISLVHKVLLKMNSRLVSLILIAPAWPCQHWFGALLDLAGAAP